MMTQQTGCGIKLIVAKGVKGDGLVWRGEWNSTTTYANIDVVSRGGASWVSVKSNNIGNDPLTDDGTWWNCMVADSLAEGYRNEALTYRNEAEDFAESAASSAESAATSASNAAESEENAAMSAANAATSETNAAISAQNAAESEANASASETKARQWAENPEDVEVEPGQYSALHHKEKAIDAQMGAETAEANALESADNAATSEANAATSAENAATSEANAKTSEINAAISEANALESANNAYTSEMNAAASEDKAAKWAQEDEDVEVEDGKYSAYHWAQKAGEIVVSPMHGDEAHTEDYVKEGDPRLSDARTPTEHGGEAHTEDYIKEGDDRLADARMPLAHAQTHVDGTDDIQLATSSQKGLMSSAYAVKLDEAVTGPASSTNGGVAIFDSTDGKVLKDGGHVIYATTDASNVYERGVALSIKGTSTAADRYTLVTPIGGLVVGINGTVYKLTTQVELNLNNSASWDSTSPNYTIAANRKGKDFYVYACEPTSGNTPVLLLSASSTYPAGYTANTSRKIGGFHCLCLSVGTISGHPLSGFVTGDILPLSVWDLLHRPKSASPEGMVWCEKANIWVDIYLQSGTGSTTASAYGATITDTRTWMDHVDDLGAVGKRLLDDAEFQLIAAGGNEKTNIQGSVDPGTTGGHVDTAGRRMISSIGCEDCAGVMYQWLSDQSFRSDYVSGWGWYDLPGAKGSLYNQDGVNGRADVKLQAGGYWAIGAECGSRCRDASNPRWGVSSAYGARGAAEPV